MPASAERPPMMPPKRIRVWIGPMATSNLGVKDPRHFPVCGEGLLHDVWVGRSFTMALPRCQNAEKQKQEKNARGGA